ncbi:hypothetical protein ZIOFF_024435 [Zingiber officinale]|uniref:Uncharacterized protein n=1 Tax=Zingiber officinale TaxID=94328 RepID=A0A8J5L683_ZINOF|nr:hypothetical protein ZIOFF_024435 [Zingiber officinale]
MANMRTAAKSSAHSGKQSFLPPKCPFPTVSPSHFDYGSIGPKCVPRSKEGQRHHQRTSSESFLIEEQPSWLDDLLNEPEMPVRRSAHRRSTSDSFAYLDAANFSHTGNVGQEQLRQLSIPGLPVFSPWNSQESDHRKDVHQVPYSPDTNSFARPQNRVWESTGNFTSNPSNTFIEKEKTIHPRSSCTSTESDLFKTSFCEKNDHPDSTQDAKSTSENKDNFKQMELDSKRVKQTEFVYWNRCSVYLELLENWFEASTRCLHFVGWIWQYAQRSRVRKLQYIAELENHVQALQAEGLEVAAELEFLDQQNLILNLENQTLKQRLDSLAQEKLIKRVQQETLEREIARLRQLYQPQPQEQPYSAHRSSSIRDLDSQFLNLSLKHKEKSSGQEPVSGPLHI